MKEYDIDELERLHEAATPGPWGATVNPSSIAFGQVDGAAWGICTVNHDDDRRPCSERDPEFDPLKHAVEDAQLIAAARNTLPELLRSARLALKAEEFLRAHHEVTRRQLLDAPDIDDNPISQSSWGKRLDAFDALMKELGLNV